MEISKDFHKFEKNNNDFEEGIPKFLTLLNPALYCRLFSCLFVATYELEYLVTLS